jgi:ferredoxin
LPICDSEKCDLCGNCVYECPTNSIIVLKLKIKVLNLTTHALYVIGVGMFVLRQQSLLNFLLGVD